MTQRETVPLGVGFYPDWFNKNYGISFDEKYYFDPETRVEARMAIDRALYERFGDAGLGDPDPKPKPLITFGMVMLPAVFGCEIVFEKDALPWAIPLNLSEDEVMKLDVPDILGTYPMTEMVKQIESLKNKYGRVVGDINTTGVQNLALKLRGEQFYIDYFENPELCRHLLKLCTQCVIELFKFNKKTTGTGAVDVTPMCDPKLCVLPNCTVEQISLETYENFVLPYDNEVADACGPVGIHHCGSVNEVMEGYAKVRHLEFLEVGFGSDVRKTRQVFGPDVAVNARINPVQMKNGSPQEIEAEVRRLIDEGAPLENFSIDTVGLTHGTPDENVRAALKAAAEYGTIGREHPAGGPRPGVYAFRPAAPGLQTTVSSPARSVVIGPDRPLVIIGERINPTGRKELARALEQGNLDPVKSEAVRQVEEGAHILDVNVGVSGIDEPKMIKEAVRAIREVTDVPLCIDSASPEALASGLDAYEGKALVNSVNGERRKLEAILPLVKDYGAAVIGLTMDDQGIPKEAEKRLRIAERIVEAAEKEGIPSRDVIIDPLAMAVSSDHEAGLETLKALQLIRHELGVNQTLGLSNISFGLPDRSGINALFLAMAVLSGLTCPIVDPTSPEMAKAFLICDMLMGKDEFCLGYISKRGPKTEAPVKEEGPAEESGDLERLKDAVIFGRRKEAVALTRKALDQGLEPQEIIDGYLIPALNVVGEKFEQKRIFVPEMMMAAKSMQASVDLLKPLMKTQARVALGTVVIGTVFGDLHDIGKNLAKLLLETSGFKVIDLGENVPPEDFVAAARENNAHIVGLSSLLTTGDPYVEATVKALRESDVGDKVKIICGGAALTLKFVEACGADAYAKDAAEGVKKSKSLLGVSG